MKKLRDGWAEETTRVKQLGKNCAIQGVRLIWKQKIWLAICEFLFRDFPVNQFNFKFLSSISTFCTNFVFLHSKNFKFLHCSGLIDMLSANQQGEIFSYILLAQIQFFSSMTRTNHGQILFCVLLQSFTPSFWFSELFSKLRKWKSRKMISVGVMFKLLPWILSKLCFLFL